MIAITPSGFEAFVRTAERLLGYARSSAIGSAHIDKYGMDCGATVQRMDGFWREWERYLKWLRAEVAAGRVLR